MPLTVTDVNRIPRATRNKKRALEGTEEWGQLKAKLAEGLKPYEAVYITFTPQQIQELGLKTVGRIFLTMTKQYIRKLHLQYDAWRFHSEGKEIVAVAARGVHEAGAKVGSPTPVSRESSKAHGKAEKEKAEKHATPAKRKKTA